MISFLIANLMAGALTFTTPGANTALQHPTAKHVIQKPATPVIHQSAAHNPVIRRHVAIKRATHTHTTHTARTTTTRTIRTTGTRTTTTRTGTSNTATSSPKHDSKFGTVYGYQPYVIVGQSTYDPSKNPFDLKR